MDRKEFRKLDVISQISYLKHKGVPLVVKEKKEGKFVFHQPYLKVVRTASGNRLSDYRVRQIYKDIKVPKYETERIRAERITRVAEIIENQNRLYGSKITDNAETRTNVVLGIVAHIARRSNIYGNWTTRGSPPTV